MWVVIGVAGEGAFGVRHPSMAYSIGWCICGETSTHKMHLGISVRGLSCKLLGGGGSLLSPGRGGVGGELGVPHNLAGASVLQCYDTFVQTGSLSWQHYSKGQTAPTLTTTVTTKVTDPCAPCASVS
jgi:hypothetical protein